MNPFSRPLLAVAVLMSALALPATPPDSLAGKILHTREIQLSTRSASERVLRFNADGTYTYICLAHASALNLAAPWKYFITPPNPATGTYTYTRTGESSASLTLITGNYIRPMRVVFQNDFSGRLYEFDHDDFTFYLTENDGGERVPLSNISVRGRVSNGHPVIAGIIVPGSQARLFLIRVVGPSLAQFGLSDLWADPDFTIYKGSEPEQLPEVHYSDWSKDPYYPNDPYKAADGFTYLFNQLRLFELTPNSKDAAALVMLPPGAHTIVCSAGPNDPGGETLIEVYSIP